MSADEPRFALRSYLKDRFVALLLLAGAIVVTAVMLACLGVNAPGIIVVEGTFVLVFACALAFDYLRRRRFWREAQEAAAVLDKGSYLRAMIEEPGFLEGEIAFGVIEALSQGFGAELQAAKDEQDEYRQYIELWVHETKAPIAAASLIAARTPLASELLPELERVERQVATALFYARATSERFDYSIRMTELLVVVRESVRQNARLLIGKGIRVDIDVDAGITVQADRQWLVFMLSQVLLNSAQYGATSIRIEAMPAPGAASDAGVRLEVGDDGEGIPAHDIGSVFERSYVGENGRRFGKSTGMGLYLVALMCARCGIGVALRSEEGVGTTVAFDFPQDLARRRMVTNS